MWVTVAPSAPPAKSSVPVTVAPSATSCEASAVAVGASSSKVTVSVPLTVEPSASVIEYCSAAVASFSSFGPQGMQHVVEQRHTIGARRRIGDLHREQRRAGPCAADGGGGQRAAAGVPAVGDVLLADRAGLAVEAGEGEAVRAGAVGADAAAERAGERRLAARGAVKIADIGIEVARRARRIAAGKRVVVDRSRRRAGGRHVGVDDVEADRRLSPCRRRRPSP